MNSLFMIESSECFKCIDRMFSAAIPKELHDATVANFVVEHARATDCSLWAGQSFVANDFEFLPHESDWVLESGKPGKSFGGSLLNVVVIRNQIGIKQRLGQRTNRRRVCL